MFVQGQHLDVICFNRYNGWYHDTGILSNIASNVVDEATAWHRRHNKPVIMTEYGADTIAGLHLVSDDPYTRILFNFVDFVNSSA